MSIKRERELAQSAAQVLGKQRDRVTDAMQALVTWIGFIRHCDLRPDELAALEYAKQFLAERKGPGREESAEAGQGSSVRRSA